MGLSSNWCCCLCAYCKSGAAGNALTDDAVVEVKMTRMTICTCTTSADSSTNNTVCRLVLDAIYVTTTAASASCIVYVHMLH
jgi:hypothetical protein